MVLLYKLKYHWKKAIFLLLRNQQIWKVFSPQCNFWESIFCKKLHICNGFVYLCDTNATVTKQYFPGTKQYHANQTIIITYFYVTSSICNNAIWAKIDAVTFLPSYFEQPIFRKWVQYVFHNKYNSICTRLPRPGCTTGRVGLRAEVVKYWGRQFYVFSACAVTRKSTLLVIQFNIWMVHSHIGITINPSNPAPVRFTSFVGEIIALFWPLLAG